MFKWVKRPLKTALNWSTIVVVQKITQKPNKSPSFSSRALVGSPLNSQKLNENEKGFPHFISTR